MEQRGHLNRIPELAASIWTGSPSEIFYDMYFGDKSYPDSMADFSSFVMTEYGEEPGFEDDEFAVEKSLYQIEMAGGADPQTLSSYAGMMTPWGPGLEIPDIASVLEEYPAVGAGFNVNDTEYLEEADGLYSDLEFNKVAEEVEQEAEDRGLLGNIGEFFSGVGEKIRDAFDFSLENLGESLTIQSQGTQDLGSEVLDMGQALGSGFLDRWAGYVQSMGEHLEYNALVGAAGSEQLLLGHEVPRTQNRLDAIEDRELKRADFRDWDQALNNDVTGLIAFFGDEQNYANGILDRATVMEWIEGLIASPLGSSDREIGLTLRETVNQAQKSAIKIDQTEETAQAFTATAQPTPTPATSMPGEVGDIMPQAPIQEAWFGSDQGLGPEATMQDEGVRAVDLDLMQASGLMPEGRFTPTEEEALMEEGLEPSLDADWTYAGPSVPAEEAAGEGESDWGILGDAPYFDRFLREFNRRPGSGRSEYQNRIGGLYNEADMLYWLHEPWSSREWEKAGFSAYDNDPALLGATFSDIDARNVKSAHERDNYSRWITGFLNSPDDLRGDNFYAAVEDLRDTMAGYEGKSETEMGAIRAENVDDGYKWLQFMDPNTSQSADRLTRAISKYNAPPDADANFNNMQFRYYSNLLRNWEAAGKSRESFLTAFTSQRPGYSPAQ